jgi:hypothetical protein
MAGKNVFFIGVAIAKAMEQRK